MLTCPHCSASIPDQYNFCTGCERQVRCTECGNELGPAKTKCLTCGVGLTADATGTSRINEYSFEEQQTARSYRRRVDLRFTDAAVEKAGPLLSRLFPLAAHNAPTMDVVSNPVRSLPPPRSDAGPAEPSNSPNQEPTQRPPALCSDDRKEEARRFFEIDGDELVSRVTDYKGKSKKEQQERFILSYVWAYQHCFGRAVPSKEHMTAVAQRAGLLDTNYRRYFSGVAKQFLMPVEGGYKLNSSGLAHAEAVLREMGDQDIEGFSYWKGKSRAPKRISRVSKEDHDTIKQWADAELDIGSLDVRRLGVVDQVMFAIWAVTKGLGVVQAVKPRMAYAYLTHRYKTVTVTSKSFVDTLSRPGNSTRFKRNATGEYYLTEEGQRQIEARMKGASISDEHPALDPATNGVSPA